MDERSAYLAFNLTPGIGSQRLRSLVAFFGSASEAWHAPADELRAAGLDKRSIAAVQKAQQSLDLEAEWAAIDAIGTRVILLDDAEYPPLLRSIEAPPMLLYVRGDVLEADRWAIAIVGTRNATTYGKEVTRMLASELAKAGITVVSGLAVGIDSIAHRTALAHNGRTLAVLGSGLRNIYPAQHQGLAEDIVAQGALISEYAPTSVPLSGNFPARNRLISGLALGTLVIEAGAQSGALITAQFALEQGRDVFAVPGSILSRMSDGPNQLIVEGATPVRSVESILNHLNLSNAITQQEISAIVPETPAEALLLPLLSREPRHIDELGRTSGLLAADVSATLGFMELKGMVRHVGGMHYVITREEHAVYDVTPQP